MTQLLPMYVDFVGDFKLYGGSDWAVSVSSFDLSNFAVPTNRLAMVLAVDSSSYAVQMLDRPSVLLNGFMDDPGGVLANVSSNITPSAGQVVWLQYDPNTNVWVITSLATAEDISQVASAHMQIRLPSDAGPGVVVFDISTTSDPVVAGKLTMNPGGGVTFSASIPGTASANVLTAKYYLAYYDLFFEYNNGSRLKRMVGRIALAAAETLG